MSINLHDIDQTATAYLRTINAISAADTKLMNLARELDPFVRSQIRNVVLDLRAACE